MFNLNSTLKNSANLLSGSLKDGPNLISELTSIVPLQHTGIWKPEGSEEVKLRVEGQATKAFKARHPATKNTATQIQAHRITGVPIQVNTVITTLSPEVSSSSMNQFIAPVGDPSTGTSRLGNNDTDPSPEHHGLSSSSKTLEITSSVKTDEEELTANARIGLQVRLRYAQTSLSLETGITTGTATNGKETEQDSGHRKSTSKDSVVWKSGFQIKGADAVNKFTDFEETGKEDESTASPPSRNSASTATSQSDTIASPPTDSIGEDQLIPEKTNETSNTCTSDIIIREALDTTSRLVEDHGGLTGIVLPAFQKHIETTIIQEGISCATTQIMATPAGELIQTAGSILSVATAALHLVKGEGTEGDERKVEKELVRMGVKAIGGCVLAETGVGEAMVISEGLSIATGIAENAIKMREEEDEKAGQTPSEALRLADTFVSGVAFVTGALSNGKVEGTQLTTHLLTKGLEVSAEALEAKIGINQVSTLNGFDPISLAGSDLAARSTCSTENDGSHTKTTKEESQNGAFGGIFNSISETVLDRTELGSVIATARETLSVVEAVKDGNATAILEDEHIQELGMKALGMAASVVLTASGAGAVMAVASVASDVIAVTREARENEESGKFGMTGFVLESGAKIALKAAMQGTGAGTALGLAAPLLEPLCQQVADKAAECGAGVLDQVASDIGLNDVLKNGLDTVVQLEKETVSVVQSHIQLVEEDLKGSTLQTVETVAQRIEGTATNIAKVIDSSEDGKSMHQGTISANIITTKHSIDAMALGTAQLVRSNVAVLEEMLVQTGSICAEIKTFDKVTNIMSSDYLAGVTKTALHSAMDTIKTRLGGKFEPVNAGLELLSVLGQVSEGIDSVNGLSSSAIRKAYELTKNGLLNEAGKHRTLFDPDGDGIVHYRDTVRGLALLGLIGPVVRLFAYNFHVMFSYPTSDEWIPRFKLTLPINIKNMGRTTHGRNWHSLSRARFIRIKDIQEVRKLSEYECLVILIGIASGNLWLVGPLAFQALLFLFEWGTMWPFQLPSIKPDLDFKLEELGPVFTNAIIPLIMDHREHFQHLQRVN